MRLPRNYSLEICYREMFEWTLNIYKYSVNWCIFSSFATTETCIMNTTYEYNGQSYSFKKSTRMLNLLIKVMITKELF